MFLQRIAVLALFLALPVSAAGPELIDIVPANAVQFLGITGTKPFSEKLDKLIIGIDPQQPGVAAFFDLFVTQMGFRNALDRSAPVAILLANPQEVLGQPLTRNTDPDSLSKLVVGTLGYVDEAKLAQDLRLDPQQMKPDTIYDWKNDMFPVPLKALYHEGRLYLSAGEKAIRSVRKAPLLRETVSKEEAGALRRCDALFLLNPRHMGDAWKDGLKSVGPVVPREGPLLAAMEELTQVVLGLRLEDGLEGHLLGRFPKDSNPGRLLASLGVGQGSTLQGLPLREEVLFAEASMGDGKESAGLGKLLASLDLPGGLGAAQLVPAAERPALQEHLASLWKPLHGERFAIYSPRNPRLGQFAALALLDSEQPDAFLAELGKRVPAGQPGTLKFAPIEAELGRAAIEQLVKDLGAEDFDTREKAAARLMALGRNALAFLEPATRSADAEVARRARDLVAEINLGTAARRNDLLLGRNVLEARPTLTYFSRAEQRRNHPISVVQLRLDPKDAGLEPRLRDLLGPDWDKIRVVPQGKQILVLLGTDTTLLEEALDLVSRNESGLARSPALQGLAPRLATDRRVELHLPLVRWMVLLDPKMSERYVETDRKGMTSLALTPGTGQLRLDGWIPLSELRAVIQKLQGMSR